MNLGWLLLVPCLESPSKKLGTGSSEARGSLRLAVAFLKGFRKLFCLCQDQLFIWKSLFLQLGWDHKLCET